MFTNTIKIEIINKITPAVKNRRKRIVRIETSLNKPVATIGMKLQSRLAIIMFTIYLFVIFNLIFHLFYIDNYILLLKLIILIS